jgi:hypothetical protein
MDKIYHRTDRFHPPVEGEEHVVTVVEFPLRRGRLLGLGTHRFRARLYWHIRTIEINESGHRLELRCQSFRAHTAEAFSQAFSKLLAHLRTESRS